MIKIHIRKKWLNKKAFTFIEILISTFISAIILSLIFKFLFVIYDEIDRNKNNINFINSTYILKNKVTTFSNKFNSWALLIDNDWSDVFLFKNNLETDWVLMAIVNMNTNKIDVNTWVYDNKTVWFRLVSENEITDINAEPSVVLNYEFMDDMLIKDFYAWFLDIKIFNTNIYDLELSVTSKYRDLFIWKELSELPSGIYRKFNINF